MTGRDGQTAQSWVHSSPRAQYVLEGFGFGFLSISSSIILAFLAMIPQLNRKLGSSNFLVRQTTTLAIVTVLCISMAAVYELIHVSEDYYTKKVGFYHRKDWEASHKSAAGADHYTGTLVNLKRTGNFVCVIICMFHLLCSGTLLSIISEIHSLVRAARTKGISKIIGHLPKKLKLI